MWSDENLYEAENNYVAFTNAPVDEETIYRDDTSAPTSTATPTLHPPTHHHNHHQFLSRCRQQQAGLIALILEKGISIWGENSQFSRQMEAIEERAFSLKATKR